MAKGYPEALAEWVQQQAATHPRQDRNVVAFLAVRADTQAAIAAGYSLKTIWAHLYATGKIAFRYETFLRHIRRHRLLETAAPGAVDTVSAKQPEPLRAPTVLTAGPGGFSFDATPKKEELI